MVFQRKLSHEEERIAALEFLCGIGMKHITSCYNVSGETIRRSIVRLYSPNWQDPLIELYRPNYPLNKYRNAAHIYLAFNTPHHNHPEFSLVDLVRDSLAYENINKSLFSPHIKRFLDETALKAYASPKGPYEQLVLDAFNIEDHANHIASHLLTSYFLEDYDNKEIISIKKIFEDMKNTTIIKVGRGDLSITKPKKNLIDKKIALLKENQQAVLKSRYGLNGNQQRTLLSIGNDMGLSKQRIMAIESQGLSKLKTLLRESNFNFSIGLA